MRRDAATTPPSLRRLNGTTYCAAYQGPKPGAGRTACSWGAKKCPYGLHKCWECGKHGHGQANCKSAPFNVFRQRTAAAAASETVQVASSSAEPAEQPQPEQPRPQKLMRTSRTDGSISIELMIWRPSQTNLHGFACLFQYACSMMNRALENKSALYIDLNQSNTLYDSFRSPRSKANWWSDIFSQPYVKSLQNEPEKLQLIEDEIDNLRDDIDGYNKDYADSGGVGIKLKVLDPNPGSMIWNTSGVWGPSRDGGLNQDKVKKTRVLIQQSVELTGPFRELLLNESKMIGLLNSETLAVHLRLTDKVNDEAPENAQVSTAVVVAKVKSIMTVVKCTAVLLCSDDKVKKEEIKTELLKNAIQCVTYGASLSDNNTVGLHFSERVPKDTQTQDVAVEVMMMASCAALLCTRSNISFMVAAMAGEKFQVFDMWTDRRVGVGSSSSAASPLTSPPNPYTFQSEDGLLKGMWVNRSICAFRIYGAKLQDQHNQFISSLGQYVILKKFDSYIKLDSTQGNQEDMPYRLEGLLDSDAPHAMMAEIDVTDPARIGLGVAQNYKVRKHATALSLLVPLLLDRSVTIQDNILSSLCELAKAKRPAAAEAG